MISIEVSNDGMVSSEYSSSFGIPRYSVVISDLSSVIDRCVPGKSQEFLDIINENTARDGFKTHFPTLVVSAIKSIFRDDEKTGYMILSMSPHIIHTFHVRSESRIALCVGKTNLEPVIPMLRFTRDHLDLLFDNDIKILPDQEDPNIFNALFEHKESEKYMVTALLAHSEYQLRLMTEENHIHPFGLFFNYGIPVNLRGIHKISALDINS